MLERFVHGAVRDGVLVVLCGPPGSGKTYFRHAVLDPMCAAMGIAPTIISPDDFVEACGYEKWPRLVGEAWARAWRQTTLFAVDHGARIAVFDAMFLNSASRTPVIGALGVRTVAIWFKTPLAVCLQRNAKRSHERCIPESILIAKHATAQPPTRGHIGSGGEGFDGVFYINDGEC